MEKTKTGMRCIVVGHVQGVWFRASAQEQAVMYHLTGWARNLPDGSVEVVAYGEKEALQTFYEWLKKGPPLPARVDDVKYEERLWEKMDRFAVK